MKKITPFDPSSAISGTIKVLVANPCGRLRLFNDSQIALLLTFPDGSVAPLPPWFYRTFVLETPGDVQWEQMFTLSSSTPPISKVYGESYERTEAEKLILSEGPLTRQLNIGNQVGNLASAENVINVNKAAGEDVVSATQSGSSGSNVLIENDGHIKLAQYVSSVLTTIFEIIPNAASQIGTIGKDSSSHNIEILCNLIVKYVLQFRDGAGTAANVMGVDGNNDTFIQAHSGGKVRLYDQTGNIMLIVDRPSANNIRLGRSSAGDLLDATSNHLYFKNSQSGDIVFQSPSGTDIATIKQGSKSLDIPTTQTSIAGTTAGNAYLYMPFTGSKFKMLILHFDGYRNATGTEQTIALPSAFTTRCIFISGNGKPVTPYSGGSPLTGKVNLNNNGSATNGNTVNSNHHGEIIAGFDALGLGTNQATQAFATYTFIGW